MQERLSLARLKLRHLRLLTAIEAAGSLGHAAQALRITQPAASRLLAEVESVAGAPLFDRHPRGLSPNAHGEVLTRRARAVMAELNAAGEELDVLRAGLGGAVALGAVTAPAVDGIAAVVTALQERHSDLLVTVEVGTSLPLVRMLLDRKLDFVLARIPAEVDAADLDYREIGDEELMFLVRDDHPFLAGEAPPLAALAEAAWVMQPPGTLLRRRMDLLFREAGLLPPERVLNTSSVLLTLAAVARGGIIGAFPAAAAALFLQGGRTRRLVPGDLTRRVSVEAFGLIRHRHRPLSPAAQRVYAAVEVAMVPRDATRLSSPDRSSSSRAR
ncbi:LysR family transcriptional regulator [Methylobacterium sp. JK268]